MKRLVTVITVASLPAGLVLLGLCDTDISVIEGENDEAYRRGIATTQQQDPLILEDEASSALAGAIDWGKTSAPMQLTSDELSTLEKLASS